MEDYEEVDLVPGELIFFWPLEHVLSPVLLRADVSMKPGSGLQIKLKGEEYRASLRYSLLRENGKWFITGFEELKDGGGRF